MNRRHLITGVPLLAAAGLSGGTKASASDDLAAEARRAWLFGLPLVIMADTRAKTSKLAQFDGAGAINVLRHADALATPETTRVTTPNVDTLYSGAFIDLTRGPLTLTVPDPSTRYMSVAVYDMYTTVDAVIGERTEGGPAGTYHLLGPGHAPMGPRDIRVSTPHAWVLARTLVQGQADLPKARELQHQLKLEGPAVPPTNEVFATREADWPDYFKTVQALVEANPPTFPAGFDAFRRLRDAGRDKSFSRDGYDAAAVESIERGVAGAKEILRNARKMGHYTDGWSYPPPKLATFGDDFVMRALVAVSGLGALPPEEAMYMRASGDDDSGLYQGDGPFRFKLAKPVPVDGFWSMTMYQPKGDGTFHLVPNELQRYAIGDRTPHLARDADGSLSIWIARKDPGGERTANWLPAPAEGPFSLTLRAYLPRHDLVDGTYRLPPVERISS